MTGEMLGLKVVPPKVFPISSLFVSSPGACLPDWAWAEADDPKQPVRVATWVKDHYPAEKFEQTFPAFSVAYWSKGINISTPEGILQALEGVFSPEEIKEIMKLAVSPENKKRVVDVTMATGAFGAPWIVAVNADGLRKDWFGNDRWDQVFYHLGVPFAPVRIVPPGDSKAKL